MPRKDTMRRWYPNSNLSDDELVNIAGWLRQYLRQEAVSPGNRTLKTLIAMEEARKSTFEISKDDDLMGQLNNTEAMLTKIKLWDADVLRVMLYSVKDRTILQELVQIGEDFYKTRIAANPVEK